EYCLFSTVDRTRLAEWVCSGFWRWCDGVCYGGTFTGRGVVTGALEAWAILRQRFNEARGFVFAVTVISWFISVAYHPDWYLDWYGADMLLFTGILYICVGLALYSVVDFLIRSLIAWLVALRKKRR